MVFNRKEMKAEVLPLFLSPFLTRVAIENESRIHRLQFNRLVERKTLSINLKFDYFSSESSKSATSEMQFKNYCRYFINPVELTGRVNQRFVEPRVTNSSVVFVD